MFEKGFENFFQFRVRLEKGIHGRNSATFKVSSQTSCKQPPKMSSLGGHLWEVVTYESSDHNGLNFSLLEYSNCRDSCANANTVLSKSQLKVNFKKTLGSSK